VKYIPTPLIGLYLLLVNLFLSGFSSKSAKQISCWIAFGVFAILVALFLRNRGVKRTSQLVVSCLAFVAFAMASPGAFQLITDWKEWFGTVALIAIATVFVVWNVAPLPNDVINDSSP
jgi:drug/metabolite transporter (DMT)-like permease